jgi:phospholipid/cholesterol/gamma-HCH transport system permease protein
MPMPTLPNTALLSAQKNADELNLTAGGSWTSSQASILESLIDSTPPDLASVKAVRINLSAITELDTFGAWLLERLLRACRADGRAAAFASVPERYRELLSALSRSQAAPAAPAVLPGPLAILDQLGRTIADSRKEAGHFVGMLGELSASLARTLVHPRTFRLTSAVYHLDRVGWQAIGIIVLITFLIGCIIAQQGFFHFRSFGADDYVVDLVAILVVREIGVLIVAIMVAGRSGSSYTAELGSMKMREEIDALRTMGLNPVDVLMLPRVLALVCALPILTFIGDMAALYGGGLVAWLYGGMSTPIYLARLQEAVTLDHFMVGMIKAPFMALVVGVVACSEGLRVAGSAESLGRRTTLSVVKSIFLVIVLDGLFAMFFASIGI